MPISIKIYISNCYSSPTNLNIQGGSSVKSNEGRTQSDPAVIAIYALRITPLLTQISGKSKEKNTIPPKQAAFANDLNGIGTL